MKKILNVTATIKKLVDFIGLINESYSVTHFEFVNNKDNWSFIDESLKDCLKNKEPVSLFNFTEKDIIKLTRKCFILDYKLIFDEVYDSYIKKHPIYSRYMTQKSYFNSFSHYPYKSEILYFHNINEFKALDDHSDYSHDEFSISFSISYSPGASSFNTNISPFLRSSNDILCLLDSKSEKLVINKKNIRKVILNFLKDVNKNYINNYSLFHKIKKEYDDFPSQIKHFIQEGYSREKINAKFDKPDVLNHNKIYNCSVFNFNILYSMFLSDYINQKIPFLKTKNKIPGDVSIDAPFLKNSEYILRIKDNTRVSVYKNYNTSPKKQWTNISSDITVFDEIISFLKEEINNNIIAEISQALSDKLQNLDNDIFISVGESTYTDNFKLSTPVYFTYKNQTIAKIIDFECLDITDIFSSLEILVIKKELIQKKESVISINKRL